jgi:hypothetical protein
MLLLCNGESIWRRWMYLRDLSEVRASWEARMAKSPESYSRVREARRRKVAGEAASDRAT